jgi:localization factor PodJL
MNSAFPEQSQDERQRAWEAARVAARDAGVPVSEWLDSVIALKETAEPLRRPRTPEDFGRPKTPDNATSPRLREFDPGEPVHPVAQEDLSGVKNRLDTLGRQLDELSRTSAGKYPAAPRAPTFSTQIEPRTRPQSASPIPPAPVPSAATPLDRALLEISQRQRALDGEVLPRAVPARSQPQSLHNLELQLHDITRCVEAMRPCAMDNAIDTIRNDLAEIAATMKEAMPRRAVEALETEVRALAQRIDTKRHTGVDAEAIAGLERGLAEMRQAISDLTPAESLVGLERALDGLSKRINLLSGGTQDPAALEQLESAIVGLRAIVSHVASNEALAKLSDEVRELAIKVDQVASTDALSTLEHKITSIADALQSRHQQNGQEARNLDAVFHGLTDKLEQLQLTRSDQTAVVHLEDRIATLVQKLDASDARLGHLESIERGLADLLVQMEQQRLPTALRGASAPELDTIKREVQRNQDALEALQSTLGQLVERLAQVEGDSGTARLVRNPTPATPGPARPAAAATLPAANDPASTGAPDRRPIDPGLPPDHPLEPGKGIVRGRLPASPAERIAASEAALGQAKPATVEPEGKSNFIAAARRAARAASTEVGSRIDTRAASAPAAVEAAPTDAPVRGSIGKRVLALLVGVSVVLLVLGSLQIAANVFWAAKDTENTGTDPASQSAPDTTAPAEAVPQIPAAPSSGRQSRLSAPPVASTPPSFAAAPAGIALPGMPALLATTVTPQMTESLLPADGVVTGSILTPAAPTAPATGADKLPTAIGSARLRTAAVNSDPAAQFEIASRLADGRGVPQDLTAAADWFERAAKQGLVPAQFRLGGLYEKGMGVKKNVDTARRFYVAAADGGNAKAMHNLAVLYAEGMEGKPDYQTAATWFRKAANYGIADSQYNLGILYARGIGVDVNMSEAYKWFSLAARGGDADAAKKRDDIGGRLDEKTLMAARAAVQVWTAEPQPEAAIEVKTPAGGWDAAAAPASAARRIGATEAPPARSTQ